MYTYGVRAIYTTLSKKNKIACARAYYYSAY